MTKQITIQNLTTNEIKIKPTKYPPDHTLRMHIWDLVEDEWFGEPLRFARLGDPPLNISDDDAYILTVIGGDQFRIWMSTVNTPAKQLEQTT